MRILLLSLFLLPLPGSKPEPQQGTAKTEIPDAGPCTSFPLRYKAMEERLAWFYGCMHENPPTIEDIQTKIAALPLKRRLVLKPYDFATQEALIGTAFNELPIQIFPSETSQAQQ